MREKTFQLDQIILNLYGNVLRKYRNIQTAYSLFTPYQHI